MKIWSVAIICVLAAVNASPHAVPMPVESTWNGPSTMNNVELNEEENTIKNFRTDDVLIVEELLADNCNKVAKLRDNSVKTIIATTDVVYACINNITRVLSSNGAVIIVGVNRAAVAIASLGLKDQADLYFNKYYVEPKSVQNLRRFCDSVLEIKAFVNSEQAIIEQLHMLVRDSKYEEAVDLSKYLYTEHFDRFKEIILPKVFNQLLQENGYEIMNFGYKLVQNKEKAIIDDCFPLVFRWIFNGDTVRLLDKERKGAMRLSTKVDGYLDRWVYTDCKESRDDKGYFKFNPVWNTTLNAVVFHIQNPHYEMKIKLDVNTFAGLYSKERLAWADHRRVDPRYAWRLIPGVNENGDLSFCIVDVVYDSYLSYGSCSSEAAKEDVKGVKRSCTPDKGWIIESTVDDSQF